MNIQLKHHPLIRTALLITCLILLISACDRAPEKTNTENAFIIPEAAKIVDFTLQHGELGRFTLDDTKGQWSLFFFGYTRCPDVCPTELFMMSKMMEIMEQKPRPLQKIPQVVFVSVDPQRDNPESLQQYVNFYHSSFIGITGEQSQVNQLAKSMGVFHERVYHKDGETLQFDDAKDIPKALENTYLINHSSALFLVNPNRQIHAIFSAPHDPAAMVRDIAKIQQAWD